MKAMLFTYAILLVLLVAIEMIYFQIANRFHITDIPNNRSSHSSTVIRGGGIILPLSTGLHAALFGIENPWFLVGLFVISLVSFWDDIHSLPDSVRLMVQLVAVVLLCYQIGILQWSYWWIVLISIFVAVGISNVFNFMDGINGMLGGYGAIVLLTLLLINQQITFISNSLLVCTLMADGVFCFFNFRPKGKAKCFSGDVGALSMAFIIIFFIGKLIVTTHDFSWLVLLVVFGIDSCLTIIHRILLHENLGQAHRKHVYQIMANELKINHVTVSGIYMIIQGIISTVFIFLIPGNVSAHWIYVSLIVLLLSVAYVLFIRKYYPLHQAYLDSLNQQ